MRLGLFAVPAVVLLGLSACQPLDSADTVETAEVAVPVRDGICTPRVVQAQPNLPPQTIMDDPDCAPATVVAPIQSVAAYTTEPLVTISGDVAFDVNSATIKERFKSELDDIAARLISSGGNSFTVVGHTDIRGSEKYNQELSEKRARSVADYLVARGVPRAYLQVRGDGEASPLDPGISDEAHRRNRRVEIIGTGGASMAGAPSYQQQLPFGAQGYSYTQAAPRYSYSGGQVAPANMAPVPAQIQASPAINNYTQAPNGGYMAPGYAPGYAPAYGMQPAYGAQSTYGAAPGYNAVPTCGAYPLQPCPQAPYTYQPAPQTSQVQPEETQEAPAAQGGNRFFSMFGSYKNNG